jgi:hypothetical protein
VAAAVRTIEDDARALECEPSRLVGPRHAMDETT